MTGRARLWVIMECYGALPLMPPVVQSPFRLPRPPPRLLRVKTFDPQRIRTSWNDSNNYGKVASNRDTWDTWDTYNPIRGKSVGRSVYPPSFLLLLLVGRFILFFTRLVHRPTTDPPPTHHDTRRHRSVDPSTPRTGTSSSRIGFTESNQSDSDSTVSGMDDSTFSDKGRRGRGGGDAKDGCREHGGIGCNGNKQDSWSTGNRRTRFRP